MQVGRFTTRSYCLQSLSILPVVTEQPAAVLSMAAPTSHRKPCPPRPKSNKHQTLSSLYQFVRTKTVQPCPPVDHHSLDSQDNPNGPSTDLQEGLLG